MFTTVLSKVLYTLSVDNTCITNTFHIQWIYLSSYYLLVGISVKYVDKKSLETRNSSFGRNETFLLIYAENRKGNLFVCI